MRRVIVTLCFLVVSASGSRADSFDHYTNDVLAKIPKAKEAEQAKKVTAEQMVAHARALPGVSGCMLVVRTNGDRWAKLLVQPGRQKVDDKTALPILLIDRFTTFREGDERAIHAKGENVRLFHNFRFNLDMGQVVPDTVPADLRFVVDGDDIRIEPIGEARIYLVNKHLPEATPKKLPKLEIGATFEPRYFNGKYKLYDDGRRSGTLHLKVADNGDVNGFYYSDKDGQKYEVSGKIGKPNHSIEFQISFLKANQQFQGLLFTGNGAAITGSSRLQERETGFYAVRLEE
jgi:hypothetical protein